MAQLYGRIARVLISLPSGSFSDTDPTQNTLIIGGDDPNVVALRIVGKLTKTTQKAPNTGELTIYNLAPTTRAKLQQKGLRVIIEVGYVSTGLPRIFVGDIRTVDHLRDGNGDLRTVLKLGDGERAVRYARASESFAAGTSVGDVVRYCANAMGLALGNVEAQAARLSTPFYHGWTVHGAASSELARVLRAVGFSYSIQDGAIQILAPGETVSQSIPMVSPQTGLIGSPEMGSAEKKDKPQALKFKALLMPEARPGGRVHVKSERYDGIFKTRKVDHSFDTMGGDWYSDYESVADNTASTA
jgi:hypothetical protein